MNRFCYILLTCSLVGLCACQSTTTSESSTSGTRSTTVTSTNAEESSSAIDSTNSTMVQTTSNSANASNFTVTVLDVGKADSILLQTQNHTVLIDCGEKSDGSDLVDYLEEQQVSSVDYLILTHYDKDHVGGAAKVIKNIEVDQILAPDYEADSSEFEKYSKAAEKAGITPQLLTETISFTLDDVAFTVYPPQKTDYGEDDDNDFSLVTSVMHQDNTFLFTGDAMEQRIDEILTQCPTPVKMLKVPYHGRELENLSELLDQVQPELAVISTDADTISEKTETLLSDRFITTYATCYDGTITIQSDGKQLTVTTENTK